MVDKIIETRISQWRFASLTEDEEFEIKDTCKKFARDMNYNFEFEYYAVYFTEANWLLALLSNPELDRVLIKKEQNGKTKSSDS